MENNCVISKPSDERSKRLAHDVVDWKLFVQNKKKERQKHQLERMEQVRAKRLLQADVKPVILSDISIASNNMPKAMHIPPVKLGSRKSLCIPVKQTLSSKLRMEKLKCDRSKSLESIEINKVKKSHPCKTITNKESTKPFNSSELSSCQNVIHKRIPITQNKNTIQPQNAVIGNQTRPLLNNPKTFNIVDSKIQKPALGINVKADICKPIKMQKDCNQKLIPNLTKNNLSCAITNTGPLKVPVNVQCRKSEVQTNVFDRLYKPKAAINNIAFTNKQNPNKKINPITNIKNNLSRSQNVSDPKGSNRSTSILTRQVPPLTVRRSLSALHFKRITPSEARNFLNRSVSVNSLQVIEDEAEMINEEMPITLPVKSDIKKSVTFLTPMRKSSTPVIFLNTPKPAILKQRLTEWLLKRGKSLSSFHHLQCFGIHNVHSIASKLSKEPLKLSKTSSVQSLDDENKENIEMLDDASYSEMELDKTIKKEPDTINWRNASYEIINETISSLDEETTNENIELLQTPPGNTPAKSQSSLATNEITSALGDLLQLILEGYDIKQCAEWLRAIKRRCPEVAFNATYWECRAALEDKRGDFYKAVDCWKRAVEEGAQPSAAEASLDGILEKFMKLHLSPSERNPVDPKLVDVKNIFKSTIIRFAINQRNDKTKSGGGIVAKYTATPVRRSSRLLKSAPITTLCINKNISNDETAPAAGKEISENGGENNGEKTPESGIPEKSTPFRISAQRSAKRTPLVQLCSSLRSVDNDIKESLIFVPNKALQFNDSP